MISVGLSRKHLFFADSRCFTALPCGASDSSWIDTQGGGNARKTRVALPWAIFFGPFGAAERTHFPILPRLGKTRLTD